MCVFILVLENKQTNNNNEMKEKKKKNAFCFVLYLNKQI